MTPISANNLKSTVWKNGNALATDTGVIMTGSAPTLTFVYDLAAAAFEEETPVQVKTVTGSNGFAYWTEGALVESGLITFGWDENEAVCTDTEAPQNAHFRVHVRIPNFDLTITKIVDTNKPTQSFIFDITDSNGFAMTVAIHPEDFGNGTTASVTIHDLPNGSYTVTERGNWSWQYTLASGDGEAKVVSTTTPEATFTNSRNTTNWLGDSEAVKNIRRGAA